MGRAQGEREDDGREESKKVGEGGKRHSPWDIPFRKGGDLYLLGRLMKYLRTPGCRGKKGEQGD